MLSNSYVFLSILSLVISVCLVVGGYFALRSGYSKTASEVQGRAIDALEAQNKAQEMQLAAQEHDLARHRRIWRTTELALKRQGLRIEVDGDSITLIDERAKRASTVQISMEDDKQPEKP